MRLSRRRARERLLERAPWSSARPRRSSGSGSTSPSARRTGRRRLRRDRDADDRRRARGGRGGGREHRRGERARAVRPGRRPGDTRCSRSSWGSPGLMRSRASRWSTWPGSRAGHQLAGRPRGLDLRPRRDRAARRFSVGAGQQRRGLSGGRARGRQDPPGDRAPTPESASRARRDPPARSRRARRGPRRARRAPRPGPGLTSGESAGGVADLRARHPPPPRPQAHTVRALEAAHRRHRWRQARALRRPRERPPRPRRRPQPHRVFEQWTSMLRRRSRPKARSRPASAPPFAAVARGLDADVRASRVEGSPAPRRRRRGALRPRRAQGVNNAKKHARAKRIAVTLHPCAGDVARLDVRDDGMSFASRRSCPPPPRPASASASPASATPPACSAPPSTSRASPASAIPPVFGLLPRIGPPRLEIGVLPVVIGFDSSSPTIYPVVRAGLEALLVTESDMVIVGRASSIQRRVGLCVELRPRRAGGPPNAGRIGGWEVLDTVRRERIETRVVVLSTWDGAADVQRALAGGASGYLSKDAPAEELFAAIRAVARRGEGRGRGGHARSGGGEVRSFDR